jgi:hypothetical protein
MDSIDAPSVQTPSPARGFKLHPLEYAGIAAAFLLCVVIGYRYAPWPITWDDLLYIHTAWYPTARPFILTRYFHIYLLEFFALFAHGDPFTGSQIFGSVLSWGTLVLVYLGARLMSGARSIWPGCVALLFMAAYSQFMARFGVTLPDYTILMMVTAGAFVYLLHYRFVKYRPLLSFLFGLLLLLALRTKETGVILLVLVPGLLGSEAGPVLRRLKWMAAGFLSGLLLMAVLNGLILGDPWFGLRVSEYRTLVAFQTDPGFKRTSYNYLALLGSTSGLLAPFLLSLVWALGPDGRSRSAERRLWLLPLSLIILLNLTLIGAAWDVVIRYPLPLLGVVAILAPQAIEPYFAVLESKGRLITALLVTGCLIAAEAVVLLLNALVAEPTGWGFRDFLEGVTTPIAICVLLGWLAFPGKKSTLSAAVILFSIGLITVPAGIQNVRAVLSSQLNADSRRRFAPFELFADQVNCTSGRVLVSQSIMDRERLLSRDQQSSQWMFNLYYGCSMEQEAFTYSASALDVLADRYQYAFLHERDMKKLLANSITAGQLAQRYEVVHDASRPFYLLVLKP